jgi:Concanavalin A-like lectin/glucanases superfamily
MTGILKASVAYPGIGVADTWSLIKVDKGPTYTYTSSNGKTYTYKIDTYGYGINSFIKENHAISLVLQRSVNDNNTGKDMPGVTLYSKINGAWTITDFKFFDSSSNYYTNSDQNLLGTDNNGIYVHHNIEIQDNICYIGVYEDQGNAPGDNPSSTTQYSSGAVYVYDISSNKLDFVTKITPEQIFATTTGKEIAYAGKRFGMKVSATNDYLFVGCGYIRTTTPFTSISDGLYIYKKSGMSWNLVQRITSLELNGVDPYPRVWTASDITTFVNSRLTTGINEYDGKIIAAGNTLVFIQQDIREYKGKYSTLFNVFSCLRVFMLENDQWVYKKTLRTYNQDSKTFKVYFDGTLQGTGLEKDRYYGKNFDLNNDGTKILVTYVTVNGDSFDIINDIALQIYSYDGSDWVLTHNRINIPNDNNRYYSTSLSQVGNYPYHYKLSFDNNFIAIGQKYKRYYSHNTYAPGAVWTSKVYNDGTYDPVGLFTYPDLLTQNGFGTNFSIYENEMIVSSPKQEAGNNSYGIVYFYKYLGLADVAPPAPPPEVWDFYVNDTNPGEGTTIILTVLSNYKYDSLTIPYTISGVDSSDINNAPLSGNLVINDGYSTTMNIIITADYVLEGAEVMTIEAPSISKTITVNINDTSIPTVTFKSTANSVNEGGTFTINATSFGMESGTVLPYTITGVSSEDLGGRELTGSFTVGSDMSVTFTVTADSLTEGNETFVLTLDGRTESISVTIVDTSRTKSYTLSSSKYSANEGTTFTITLNAENVDNGTVVPYTITGVTSEDINNAPLTGAFTVINQRASLTVTVTNDYALEGLEAFVLTLDGMLQFVSVDIIDTSIPTYRLTSTSNTVNEGDTFIISLVTQGVPDGTSLPYTITGISSADINGASLTGSFVVGVSTDISFTVTADVTTEGSEVMVLALDTVLADIGITILDTSQPASYTLTASAENVNEGGTVTITLGALFVANGVTHNYEITGVTSDDINGAPLTGTLTVNNQAASVTLTIKNDFTTEGSETLVFTVPSLSKSVSVNINDTSIPTYTLSKDVAGASVNEGVTVIITLTTQGVSNGTVVPYTITGISSADINGASLTGSFVVGTSDTVTLNITNDVLTEGDEAFVLSLDGRTEKISFNILDTSQPPVYTLTADKITANEGDTVTFTLVTQYLANGVVIPFTITGVSTEDITGGLTGNFIVGTTMSVSRTIVNDFTTEGNETLVFTLDGITPTVSVSVGIVDTSREPTYALSSSSSIVEEGSLLIITLSTEYVLNDTLVPYTITGNVALDDLNLISLVGNFTVINNKATLLVEIVADYITEGIETLTLTLDNQPTTSVTVQIKDKKESIAADADVELFIDSEATLAGLSSSNNAFIEESGNSFTVTKSGDVAQGSFSPFCNDQGRWSTYFSGAGDYLSYVSTIALGTGDFTVECWVNISTAPSVNAWVIGARSTNTSGYLWVNSTLNAVWGTDTGTNNLTSNVTIVPCVWTHVAVSKVGSTIRIFINGVLAGQQSDTNNYSYSGTTPIGYSGSNYYFNGYISNLHVTKAGLYNTTFTVSTTPIISTSNTVFLGCSSNLFKDVSSNKFTVAANGPMIRPYNPYGPDIQTSIRGGSSYFDGSGDFLEITNTSDKLVYGTEPFTIECWVYPTIASFSASTIFQQYGKTNDNVYIELSTSTSTVNFGYRSSNYTTGGTASCTGLKLNAWNHLAYVRDGTQVKGFLNGVLGTPLTIPANASITENESQLFDSPRLGAKMNSDGQYYTGFISNFRIVKGTALYSSNFTVPNKLNTENSTVLLNFNSAGAIDLTNNNVFTTVNNVAPGSFTPFSADQGKWSVFFNGTTSYLTVGTPTNWTFLHNGSTVTVECWFMTFNGSNAQTIASTAPVWNSYGFKFMINNSGSRTIGFYVYRNLSTSLSVTTLTNSYDVGVWVHVAYCFDKDTNTGKIYVNGVEKGTTTATYVYGTTDPSYTLAVGRLQGATPTSYFNGYISNLRIIKDAVVYTGPFTVSTTPLSLSGVTSLLTTQSNTFKDSSPNDFNTFSFGNATISPKSPFGSASYDYETMGGSYFFDGTTDYLIAPSIPEYVFNKDHTIEAWVFPLTTTISDMHIFGTGGSGSNDQFGIRPSSSGNLDGYILWNFAGLSSTYIVTNANIPFNAWTHIAVSRVGNNLRAFVNGVLMNTMTASNIIGAPNTLWIGRRRDGNNQFYGYISNLRVINGTGLYSATFGVPQLAPEITNNTVLLTNGVASSIYDNTSKSNIESVNGVSSTSNILQNGSYTIRFDGVEDRLVLPASERWYLGSSYTVEGWFNFDTLPVGATCRLILIGTNNTNTAWTLEVTTDGKVAATIPMSIVTNYTLSTPANVVAANKWYHLAVSSSNGACKIFVNGVEKASGTLAIQSFSSTNPIYIGYDTVATVNYQFKGYMDDVKITKRALYTADFTPPGVIYNLTSDVTTANEGDSVTFTLTHINGENGASVPYTITGINQNDLSVGSLTGSFTIGSKESITITLANDMLADGDKVLKFTIDKRGLFVNVTIKDTSGPGTYTLTTDYNIVSLYEGRPVTFRLKTTYTPVGATYPYTITGVTSEDISGASLSGSIVTSGLVSSNEGTLTLNISADTKREGKETLVVKLPNLDPVLEASVDILDSSTAYEMSPYDIVVLTGEPELKIPSPYVADISGNNYNIGFTTPANAVGSTFTPLARLPGEWSMYFDGSSHLTVPANAAYLLGTNNFTIELFAYLPSPASQPLVTSHQTGGMFSIGVGSSKLVGASFYIGSSYLSLTGLTPIKAGIWYHIAVVRNGSTITLYLNGTSDGTLNVGGSSISSNGGNKPIYIGAGGDASSKLNKAYISSFHYVNGNALYTGNFTPPAGAITSVANTKILTCNQYDILLNQSSISPTLTVGSGRVVASAYSPFTKADYGIGVSGSSIYLEYSNSVSISSPVIGFSSGGDFTIECFFYQSSDPGDQYIQLIGTSFLGSRLSISNWGSQFQFSFNGSWYSSGLSRTYFYQKWVHIAFVFKNKALYTFIDGKQRFLSSGPSGGAGSIGLISYDSIVDSTVGFGGNYSNGYLFGFRVSNSALYSSDFTPVYTQVPSVTSNTLVLLESNPPALNQANVGALLVRGAVATSTTYARNGARSLFFNGVSDYLELRNVFVPNEPITALTIEMWIYPTLEKKGCGLISEQFTGAGDPVSFAMGIGTNGGTTDNYLWVGTYTGSTWNSATSTITPQLGVWMNVAGVYNNGYWNLFVNGDLISTSSASPTISGDIDSVYIGRRWDLAGNPYFSGYIDDLVISKTAKYTSSYVPKGEFYGVTASVASVNEGGSVTITLTTQDVVDGTIVPYTVTGVSTEDVNGASLTGTFVVGSITTVTYTFKEDLKTEGNETFLLTLDGRGKSASVVVVDSSREPTYTLVTTPTTINEGLEITITFNVENVVPGVSYPYTITGVSSEDISGASLTGSLTPTGTYAASTATVVLTVAADLTTEGTEYLTFTLDGMSISSTVTINDTSQPAVYTLSSSAAEVNEGGTFTITLNTQFVAENTVIPYTITGVSTFDLTGTSLTGNFTIVNSTASKSFNVASDFSVEGDETFVIKLNDIPTVTTSVVIKDTSVPTYVLSATPASKVINEGDTLKIKLTTQGLLSGSKVPYTITGVSSADISGASLTGDFTVGSDEELSFTVSADMITEGTETLVLSLNNSPESISITINDTSVNATFNLTSSVTSSNEGSTFTVTLSGTGMPNGYVVPYIITGVSSEDINNASLTGNFTVNNNSGSVNFTVTADYITEGTETFVLSLVDSPTTTVSVTINDTSVPTYVLSSSASTVNEPGTVTFTLTTYGVANGTVVPYTVSGVSSDDIGGASTSGTFVVGTSNTVTFNITSDKTTEGTERLTVSLNGRTETAFVDIIDTSQAPIYSLAKSPTTSINEGSTVTITLNTQYVDDNTVIPYTITGVTSDDINGASLTGSFTVVTGTANVVLTIKADKLTEGVETLVLALDGLSTSISVIINDTSVTTVSYTLTASPANSVDEGGSIVITLTSENAAPGTVLPYTITGVTSEDISGMSLTGTFVVGTQEIVMLNLSLDLTTEGPEVLKLSLDGRSEYVSVTINDTSLAPSFLLTSSKTSIIEGQSVRFNLTTSNVISGSQVQYTITGITSSEISNPLTGSITITDNFGYVDILTINDNVVDGDKVITFTITGTPIFTNVTIIDADSSMSKYNNVLLFINGDTQNKTNNNNNLFVDSSSFNYPITRVGNVAKGSYSPYVRSEGYWSYYFDGTGDYLTCTDTSNLAFSNNDFTIEAWVYVSNPTSTAQFFLNQWETPTGSDTNSTFILQVTTKFIANIAYNNATTQFTLTGATTIKANTWYHVALTRSGATIGLYVNGVREATNTTLGTFAVNNSNAPIYIGTRNGGTSPFKGYLSNIRIINGRAMYTSSSSFVVPTMPFKNVVPSTGSLNVMSYLGITETLSVAPKTGFDLILNSILSDTIDLNNVPVQPLAISFSSTPTVVLLIGQNSSFKDNSVFKNIVNASGNVTVTPFTPFETSVTEYVSGSMGGSTYFDGSDYLSLPSNMSIYAKPITIEAWVNPSAYQENPIFEENTGDTNGEQLIRITSGGKLVFEQRNTHGYGATLSLSGLTTIPINAWTHVAIVLSNKGPRIYVNGRLDGIDNTVRYWNNAARSPSIGINGYGPAYFKGYISNFTIVDGAKYVTDFTLPTSYPTTNTNTKLLITSDSTTISDSSSTPFTITKGGNVTTSSLNPFGTNNNQFSILFDGNGDYLTVPVSDNLKPTGDFTFELWISVSASPSGKAIAVLGGATSTAGNIILDFNSTGYFRFNSYNSAGLADVSIVSTVTPTLNTWYHIAAVRMQNTYALFINGICAGSTTVVTDRYVAGTYNVIGGQYRSGAYNDFITGNIAGTHLVNGTCLYSPIINVPVSYSIADEDTILMIDNTNNAIFDKSANANIETVDQVTAGGFSPFAQDIDQWSVQLSSNSSITVAANTALDLTGDFTIELWAFIQGADENYFLSNGSQSGSACYRLNANTTTGVVTFSMAITTWAGLNLTSGSNAIMKNKWHHIAITRASNAFKLFIDGVISASATNSGSLINTGRALQIGYFVESTATKYAEGYISNLRIVKGTALYTTAFTPSTTPLTAVSGTSLLTCNNNALIDYSSNKFTLVNSTTSTAKTSPFSVFTRKLSSYMDTETGSVLFDGGGDYLKVNHASQVVPLIGDFTAEAWIYPTSYSTNQYGSNIFYFYGNANSYAGLRLAISRDGTANTGKLVLLVSNTGSSWQINSTGTYVNLNAWSHIAITRTGSSFVVYLNGVSSNTGSLVGELYAGTVFYIGSVSVASGSGDFSGYISNVSVIRSVKYTSGFTLPTSNATLTKDSVLLLDFNNGGIVDFTDKYNLVTNNLSQAKTNIFKNGNGSMYFSGSSDYVKVNGINLSSTDFTIDFWFYPLSLKNGVFFRGDNGTTTGVGLELGYTSSGALYCGLNGNSTNIITTSNNLITINQWNQITYIRKGSDWYIHVNGPSVGTGNNSSLVTTPTQYLIGGSSNGASLTVDGYIDDFYISLSSELYTLSSSLSTVNNNSTLTVTLTTRGVSSNTIPFTITGITSAELSGASLTDSFTMTGDSTYSTGTKTFKMSFNNDTNYQEKIKLNLDNNKTNILVSKLYEVSYTSAGTYSWVCPTNVNSVSVVCVGGGGGGSGGSGSNAGDGQGGGGGGLGYKNNISVVPGQTYTVVVGSAGAGNSGSVAGSNGGDSYFISTSIVKGGGGGGSNTRTGGTFTGDGGGNGGTGGSRTSNYVTQGGGGAGGYSGNGGNGASSSGVATAGTGGGGGGGYSCYGSYGSSGGGVGLNGSGTSGSAGAYTGGNNVYPAGTGGGGGSGGTSGTSGNVVSTAVNTSYGGTGGNYGGGGGGSCSGHLGGSTATVGGSGGVGAVRIISGAGKSFPDNAT